MNEKFFMKYEDHEEFDDFAFEFQRRGQINIRIDADEAMDSIRKGHNFGDRDQYNYDTMMAIICNSGHGGTSTLYIDLYINFQPQIVTAGLPPATEGVEYNRLRDTTRAIRIFDPNTDQRHTFQLLYSQTTVALDPAFPDETTVTIPANTPD
jgi:hypothetical protein